VLQEYPEVCFEIAGNEDLSEPGFKAKLIREIERLGVGDKVVVRGFSSDPQKFILSLDCLVNPSYPAEPFGMSIIETMALGRPVVATREGGPAEIIEDGRSGLLVPPRDPKALTAAMLRLIRDRDLCTAIGDEARRRVADRFEVKSQVAKQEAFLRRVLDAG